MLIDKGLRAILIDGRYGPEALVLQGDSDSSSTSPAAPWDSFTVSTYLDVDYPSETSGQYQFEIHGFFRVHPIFVVKAFGRHARGFPFPAAHCVNGQNDGAREDGAHGGGAPPHGGAAGSGSFGSPSPRAVPRGSRAAAWSEGLLSAKNIVIVAGGLLLALGVPAAAWLRRRGSAA
ncbi:hypothetical protein AB0C59_21590 [Streptomyces sp. NPDC048664]|uniref:hypothetical protein n=1 Tax=Streptomyces sp. NPDC048664 TaxID=3154505 RepID=UPI003431F0F5